jgi:hypothetical protein
MHLEYLNYHPEPVTEEQFRLWRSNPCTRELKQSLILAFLEQISDDLPESVDKSIPLMHQREGAKKTIELIMDWHPLSMDGVDYED